MARESDNENSRFADILEALAHLPANREFLTINGARLRELRRALKINQGELGEGFMSQPDVSRIERNLRTASMNEAEGLAAKVHASLADLINPS